MNRLTQTAPERIWLQISDCKNHTDEMFPPIHGDITWCQDSVGGSEVPYVRADLYEAQSKQLAEVWRRCNIAEAKVAGWERQCYTEGLPQMIVMPDSFGTESCGPVSVPRITPKKYTELLDRLEAAQARIAELEKHLKVARDHMLND